MSGKLQSVLRVPDSEGNKNISMLKQTSFSDIILHLSSIQKKNIPTYWERAYRTKIEDFKTEEGTSVTAV